MTDWNAVSAFMANVVAWPGSPTDPGYVNLHFSSTDRKNPAGPLRKGSGWPFRSVDTFVGRASWINTTTQFKDVWFCLSLQSQTKPNAKDPQKPRAHRLAANALKVKSLWIDIDVGVSEPGKKPKYSTLEGALKAIIQFREQVGLPPFSALVASGSGLHAYWISKDALTVRDWAPYAEGLKAVLLQKGVLCDAGLTTDVARILRVPGTFNHKTTPPKPVTLLNVPLVMYDFPTDLGFLPQFAPEVAIAASSQTPGHNLFAEGVTLASFGKPALTVAGPDLNAGIERESPLLKVEPIFKQCGFFKDALLTGGANFDQTLWMYSVLGATFMENGNAIAHAISKEHADYSPTDTQALYDRKVAERADRGVGYPSCAAIQSAGCKSCATCPLFSKGKSPLNIRPIVTATVTGLNMAPPLQQTAGAQALNLPEGYDLDPEGYICELVQNEINGELMPPTYYRLFWSKITDPWVQTDPDSLNFTATRDKGKVWQAQIKHEDMGSMGIDRAFSRQHVKIFPRNKARLEHFIVSWLAKLHELSSAQQALPFGWYKEGDAVRGFVYGGKLMRDDGTETPCGVGDPKIRAIFHPTGDIQPWFNACKLITQQKRPELDAIIALSFSAPLTALVGKNAVTMCAYGESGAGKTAAYSCGIAVWGHSKRGKAVSHSTFNGVMKKMGELSNLPLYWDEIKNPKAQAAVYDFVYNASDGVEKDRMKDGERMADKGIWQTQMMAAANISFVDYVMTQDKEHVAGVSRVLEYHVKKRTSGPGRISQTDADVIIDKLMTSYGQMGLLYAKLLAMNHDAIQAECIATCKQVEKDLQNQDEERLWVALVGTLLVGARLANTLGCDFDLPALKDFLYRTYLENREKRDSLIAIGGARETTEGVMTSYFAKVNTNDQAMWTIGMPQGVGKPEAVTTLHTPKDTKNVSVTTAVAVRWDVQEKKVYILKDHLVAFLAETGKGVGTTLQSLQKEYGMKYKKRVRIGAGVFFTGRATCCVISSIGLDHEWADMLHMYTPENMKPKDDDPDPEQTMVDTGLTPVADVVAFVHGATAGAG